MVLKKKQRAVLVSALCVVGLAGAGFLYFHNPSEGRGLIPCPIYSLTGFYCTGCGTTRALYSLLHLNFIQAFEYNAALCILFPLLTLYGIVVAVQYILYGSVPLNRKLPSNWLLVIAVALVLFGIVRNFIPVLQPGALGGGML